MFELLLELPLGVQLLVFERLSANDIAAWAVLSRGTREIVGSVRARHAAVSLALSNRRAGVPRKTRDGPWQRLVARCSDHAAVLVGNAAAGRGADREEAAEQRGVAFAGWLAGGGAAALESLSLAVRRKLPRAGSNELPVPCQLVWQPPLTTLRRLAIRMDELRTIVCVRNVVRGCAQLQSLKLALPELPEHQHLDLSWLVRDMAPQLQTLEIEAAGLLQMEWLEIESLLGISSETNLLQLTLRAEGLVISERGGSAAAAGAAIIMRRTTEQATAAAEGTAEGTTADMGDQRRRLVLVASGWLLYTSLMTLQWLTQRPPTFELCIACDPKKIEPRPALSPDPRLHEILLMHCRV